MHPNTRLGYFGIFPRYSYFESHRYPASTNTSFFDAQTAINDRVQPLADAVDIIFPSLYTVPLADGEAPTNDRWLSRARALIEGSSRYEKPVYALLWTDMSHRDTFWHFQLQQTRHFADKVALQGGPNDWHTNDRWHLETIDYLEDPAPYSPPAGD